MDRKIGIYQRYFKRLLDIIGSLVGIICLSPILVIVAILVRTKLGSPVLFRQERPGKHGKIFRMYKFRSMTDQRDAQGELLPDGVRLTAFGKMLRATSLDELPELFNILKGDMSIVGPRPQLIRDMVFMTHEQNKRHDVLPGLTGWAQINGRNNISWEKKLSFDLEYIEHISLLFDIKIVAGTILKVLRKKDITTDNMETAEDLGVYLLRKNKISNAEFERGLKQAEAILHKNQN